MNARSEPARQGAPADAPAGTAPAVNDANPWLGLASFTEETRAYFYGREEEVAELARRVQRKLLTVLFGKSGLGKTSILRAGLAPRLRAQGYCPVYVRIDYGRDSPEPAEQIKESIRRAARRSGEWTQAGVAVAGETLWEFLHHRDDLLRDDSGATLVPLLIFDQFEELFTLAQSDEFGRARAARFVEELADLVENRPPKVLEARIERDESAAERFDFARSDYRVLIALREDYLAPLEGLKRVMPSVAQNRQRLAPMTGAQALEAVLRPGRGIVAEEVAAAIVRFVAGGAEIANAEVEPSLLSLICRELNDARIAQGRSEISLDLLAGTHASILSNFYERALADQGFAVRRIIEDELLTASGFRESVSEESLLRRFAAAGAAPDTLAVLVNRRLLRIEERLDVRRVELTHDVLCGVVKASRDARHEREAREATERLLAEQRERERAARAALVRARRIAVGCTLLALVALAAAVIAVLNGTRARRAEHDAETTRAVAEQARAQSEHLLGYLTDDFVRELESFGRLQVIAEFAQRQIDYFRALPPDLKSSETVRNGALALTHHGRAERYLGDLDRAGADVEESVGLLEGLRHGGDRSEATEIALARALTVQAQILDNRNDPKGPEASQRAAVLLRPLIERPGASEDARRAYVDLLIRIGYEQQSNPPTLKDAVETTAQAMRIAEELGAHGAKLLNMGAQYAEAGAWRTTALGFLGRDTEARRVGADVLGVADQVLEQRPGYRLALHAEQVTLGALSSVAQNELEPADALRIGRREEEVGTQLLRLDPKNTTSLNNLASAQGDIAEAFWGLGQVQEAIASWLKSVEQFGQAAIGGPTFFLTHSYQMAYAAMRQAQSGDPAGALRTGAADAPYRARLERIERPGSFDLALVELLDAMPPAYAAFEREQFKDAAQVARETLEHMQATSPSGEFQTTQRHFSIYITARLLGQAQYRLGDYAEAERAERLALQERQTVATDSVPDRRDLAEAATWTAMAVARQGRLAEAGQSVAPAIALYRDLARRNHGNRWIPIEHAAALYAEALAEPAHRPALLAEAARQLDQAPAALRSLRAVRQWREWVHAAAHAGKESSMTAAGRR